MTGDGVSLKAYALHLRNRITEHTVTELEGVVSILFLRIDEYEKLRSRKRRVINDSATLSQDYITLQTGLSNALREYELVHSRFYYHHLRLGDRAEGESSPFNVLSKSISTIIEDVKRAIRNLLNPPQAPPHVELESRQNEAEENAHITDNSDYDHLNRAHDEENEREKRDKEKIRELQKRVDTCAILAAHDPDAFNIELADLYHALAIAQDKLNYLEEAVGSMQSAIRLRAWFVKRDDKAQGKSESTTCTHRNRDALNVPLAESYHILMEYLGTLERYEEAVDAGRAAVQIRESLVSTSPDAAASLVGQSVPAGLFQLEPALSESYHDLAYYLSKASRAEDAIETGSKAVQIRVLLSQRRKESRSSGIKAEEAGDPGTITTTATTEPTSDWEARLAESYHNLASYHYDLKQYEEAIRFCRIAIDIRQHLVESASKSAAPDAGTRTGNAAPTNNSHVTALQTSLASSYLCAAAYLGAAKRHRAASFMARRSLSLYKTLHSSSTDAFASSPNSSNVNTITNAYLPLFNLSEAHIELSIHLSALSRLEDASFHSQEGLRLLKRVPIVAAEAASGSGKHGAKSDFDFDVYSAELGDVHDVVARHLHTLGRTTEALKSAQSAVRIRMRLLDSDVDFSLESEELGRVSSGCVNNTTHALTSKKQCTRALTEKLSNAQHNLAIYLGALGRYAEATEASREAVFLQRAALNQALSKANASGTNLNNTLTLRSTLSASLHNYSTYLDSMGRTHKAIQIIQESLRLRRPLAAHDPHTYSTPLADSYHLLAGFLRKSARYDEAIHYARRAVLVRTGIMEGWEGKGVESEEELSEEEEGESYRWKWQCMGDDAMSIDEHEPHNLRASSTKTDMTKLAESYHTLARILADSGSYREAVPTIQAAINIRLKLNAMNSETNSSSSSNHDTSPNVNGGERENNITVKMEVTGESELLDHHMHDAICARLSMHTCNIKLGTPSSTPSPNIYADPDLAEAQYDLGLFFINLYQLDQARVSLQTAVEIYSSLVDRNSDAYEHQLADALLELASVYDKLDYRHLAVRYAQLAVDIRTKMSNGNSTDMHLFSKLAKANSCLAKYSVKLEKLQVKLELVPAAITNNVFSESGSNKWL